MNRPRFQRARSLRAALAALLPAALVAGGLTLLPSASAAVPTPTCDDAGIDVVSLGGPSFYIDSGSSPSFRSGYTGYQVTTHSGATSDTWVSLTSFTGGVLGLAPGQPAAQRIGDLADGVPAARFWYLRAASTSAVAQRHTITVWNHDPSLPTAVALCTTTDGFNSVEGTLDAAANKVTGITVAGTAPRLGATFTVSVTGTTGTIGQGVAGDLQSFWMSPAVADDWPAGAFRLVSTNLLISADGTAPATNYVDTLRVAGLGSSSRPYTATYTFQAVGTTSGATALKPVQEISSGTQVKHTGDYPASLPAIQAPVSDLAITTSVSPASLPAGGGRVTFSATTTGTVGALLDSYLLTLPAGATIVPGTASWGGLPIGDPVLVDGVLTFVGPFTVGGPLTVDVVLDATAGPRTFSLLGALGASRIGRTTSPTDGSNPAQAAVVVAAPTPPPSDPSPSSDPTPSDPSPSSDPTPSDPSPSSDPTPSDPSPSSDPTPSDPEPTPSDPTPSDPNPTPSDPNPTPSDPPPAPLAQTIVFAPASTSLVDSEEDADGLALLAVSDAGLPVDLEVTEGSCTITITPSGPVLHATAAGSCTVRATQPGDETHEAATPVSRVVSIVSPTDDEASTPGATPVLVDVLGNDPGAALLTLTAATAPAHGTATLVDGQVRYQPARRFRGRDTFTYTVVLNGRSATASVVVVVADLAPSVAAPRVTMPAGTVRTVPLVVTDPNGDEVTVAATSPERTVGVRVDGSSVQVSASGGASGDVAIALLADDGAGGTARTVLRVRIIPLAPTGTTRRPTTRGTVVAWQPAPTVAAAYDVLVDGVPVCSTTTTRCTLPGLVGPGRQVEVRTRGRDGTLSSTVAAPLTGHGRVLLATVYFDTGKDVLTAAAKARLDDALDQVRGSGFAVADVDGYTDADGGVAFNRALSQRRTARVAAYLKRNGQLASRQAWHGESDPVASNSAASGKARNRRVEILVRY